MSQTCRFAVLFCIHRWEMQMCPEHGCMIFHPPDRWIVRKVLIDMHKLNDDSYCLMTQKSIMAGFRVIQLHIYSFFGDKCEARHSRRYVVHACGRQSCPRLCMCIYFMENCNRKITEYNFIVTTMHIDEVKCILVCLLAWMFDALAAVFA